MGKRTAAFAVTVVLAASCSSDDPTVSPEADEPADEAVAGSVSLEAVSRPEYVTGGDVLVRYVGPADPVFTVDGTELAAESRGNGLYLLAGLADGPATIETGAASLDVVNHPITGPVFSGPHQEPLYCTIEMLGLEATGDDDCSAETVVDHGYLTDDEEFVPLGDGDPPEGALIVRRETGTINRGIYTFVVADPSAGEEPIEPGRNLIYLFGGGCGTGHVQSTAGLIGGSDVLDADALAAGYVMATSSFNVLQTHCNSVLSAETLMMVQEHIGETIGPLGLTIGRGGSGGAIQQYSIVQNYPGLLDAVHASVSFPDQATIAGGVSDCGLLLEFFRSEAGAGYTEPQRQAIQGHGTVRFCDAWEVTFLWIVSPSEGCDEAIPEDAVYDAATNPDGIRCTLQDTAANLFGVDERGFARRALDNVGVQYGLRALDDGEISVDQFLDLNEAVGGYDIDGNIVAEREVADPEVLELAYATGRVLQGDTGVRDVPIIDVDLYSDLGFDIHDRFRLFSIRARMADADGTPSGNRVIWTRDGAGLLAALQGDTVESVVVEESAPVPSQIEIADLLVEWATTGERPEGVADDCVVDGERLVGDDVFDEGQPCAEAYPYFGDPRTAAGAPIENDIIKCTTVPVDSSAYGVEFTDAQATRLAEVFPDGVCDWTVPGEGQVPLGGTWLDY